MGYVIGIDIGTSSTRAVIFDLEGTELGRRAQAYGLISEGLETGAAEQRAEEIAQAAIKTVAGVIRACGLDPRQIVALSLSAAMHTLLLVDAAGQPLTPLYTWADSRSASTAARIKIQDPQLYQRTGLPAHPLSPLVKLVWLRQHQPESFARLGRAVTIKEYVLHQWCGEWVIDLSMASTTGLFNFQTGTWDLQSLALAHIEPHQLSQIVPTTYCLTLGQAAAVATGLPTGTPVVVGASDGVLANLGVGAIAAETAAITLGTSGAVRQAVAQPKRDSQSQLFCYALTDQQWIMGGAVNNGGIVLQWVKDCLVPYVRDGSLAESAAEPAVSAASYERLLEMAAAIAPGSEGLIFHPYLLGERSPLWNAQARGSFFGLGRQHTQAHLIRAVLEGVLYNLHQVFETLEQVNGSITSLRASGGFARSTLWSQMLADIFERPIEIPKIIESSAFGAAVLALVALGYWDSLEAVRERVAIAHCYQPIATHVNCYQRLLPVYRELLTALEPHYAALQRAIAATE